MPRGLSRPAACAQRGRFAAASPLRGSQSAMAATCARLSRLTLLLNFVHILKRRGKRGYGLARATQAATYPAAWAPSAMLRPTRPHHGLRCARASRHHNGQARSASRRAEGRRPQACAARLPRADFRGLRARARCGLRCAGVRALHGFLGGRFRVAAPLDL